MSENKNIISIQKSREILLNILSNRGFNASEYNNFSLAEIHALFTNKQLDILLENPITKKKIYIKYYLEKTVRPINVHEIIDDLYNIEQILKITDDFIIIIKDEPNDTLQKLQTYIYEHDKIFISIINIERLQFNILEHVLVPPHRPLDDIETLTIKEKFNITDNKNFPSISRFDPVAQVLGLRPNQLCEIIRSSKTSITSKYYRICSL